MINKDFKFYHFLGLVSCLFLFACAKDKNKIEDNSFSVLKEQADEFLAGNRKVQAIDVLEKMIEQYPDNHDISNHYLVLADLYFDRKDYQSADSYYKRFYTFNPSDIKAEYASYRSAMCKFYQTCGIKRDPTNIRKCLKRVKKHLENVDYQDKKYLKELNDIKYTCEKMLVDREVYIHNFYLKKGKLKSAQNRLDYIKKEFAAKNPQLNSRVLFLEAKLAQKQKNDPLAREKLMALQQNHPESKFTSMATRIIDKSKQTFIF